MSVTNILVALLLGLLTYFIAGIFLAPPLPLLFAILVAALVLINGSPRIA